MTLYTKPSTIKEGIIQHANGCVWTIVCPAAVSFVSVELKPTPKIYVYEIAEKSPQ
jgi:hypothetical protein